MTTSSRSTTRWARWAATFIGFPAGGVAARLLIGDVDGPTAAALGGAAAGAVLGAVQAFVGGIAVDLRVRWIMSTAAGLGAGLLTGAASVGYRTDATSLVAMGALCGAFVGVAQGFAIPMPTVHRVAWIVATSVLWAMGWLVTSQVIVDAERQHAVFGSSGALVVSALSGILVAVRPVAARLASGSVLMVEAGGS